MANISISNLHVTGTDLFADSESYMHELSNKDLTYFLTRKAS